MNATEQRTHRTVTAALGQQCADLLAITEALDARVLTLARIGHSTLDQVRTLRQDIDTAKLDAMTRYATAANVAEAVGNIVRQLATLRQEHKMLREAYSAHERACLTLRGRLWWLLKGGW